MITMQDNPSYSILSGIQDNPSYYIVQLIKLKHKIIHLMVLNNKLKLKRAISHYSDCDHTAAEYDNHISVLCMLY